MSKLADALQVLLDRAGIPQESEDRDAVESAIDELRNPVAKRTTKQEDK